MKTTAICQICGKPFVRRNGRQLYCLLCRDEAMYRSQKNGNDAFRARRKAEKGKEQTQKGQE